MHEERAVVERIRVRYGETDAMGHAYYANYLYWFEQARGAWCRANGFTYRSLEQQGFKLPVVEVGARYRGEVKYDDEIAVKVWVSEMRRASIKFEYEITNESTGVQTTTGFTWHVVVGETMKAVTIPSFLREKIEPPVQ
ncbi:MAG: acyl-CoA thioesterase [Fimbriimonadaceae bacterium]|nr:acyl-CoA thioesterase [Fimbriimonadaceae bacterium]